MANQLKNRGRVARATALCLLALGAMFSHSRAARAQWTTSGTNTTTTDNVGIGTTAPSDRLEINGNVANGGGLTISTSGNARYRVGTVGTTVPNWGGQIMNAKFNQTTGNWTQDDSTLNSAFIKLDLRNLPYGNEMGFYRMAAGGTNPRPDTAWVPMAQFKLDTGNILLAPTSGNVGIGTDAPGTLNGVNYTPYIRLHVKGQGTTQTNIVVDSAWPGSGYVLNDNSQPADGRIWSMTQGAGNGKLSFSTYTDAGTPTHRLVIDRAGNVGFGTQSPLSQFHLHGSSPRFRISGDATDQHLLISFHDNNNSAVSKGFVGYLGANGTGARYTGIINTGGDYLGLGTTSATPVYFFLGGAPTHVMAANGNVGIGTTAPSSKLHVVGDITVTGNINAKYQDVAEWVPSTQKLEAGTVVVLDTRRDNHVASSSTSYDTRVAGVISARPGIALGEAGEGKVLVATTGRVRVKVDATQGAVGVGDLLVTSDRPGYAMKSEPVLVGKRQMHSPGTIIGKALEPLEKGTGEILVLLSLQ